MAYIDYEYYKTLYGKNAVDESKFMLLSYDAGRKIDRVTTGVDGVKKLKVAFPDDEEDIEAVKRCACKLIELMNSINEAEKRVNTAHEMITRADGTIQGKVVSSVSAGSESITFSTGSNASLIDKVLADKTAQERLYRDIVYDYLSGISDNNGVNLLYMGPYPYISK